MSEEMPERKMRRLESKKKKLRAFLDIAESNNEDRRKRMKGSTVLNENQINTESQPTVKTPVANKGAEVSQTNRCRLSKEEYAELKKRRKEMDKAKMVWPRIFLNSIGEFSSLNLTSGKRCPLFMSDIQSLLLYSLLHNRSPSVPRWARMVRTRKYSHVVTVIIEGIGLGDFANADSSEVENNVCPEDSTPENGTAQKPQAEHKKDNITSNDCNQKGSNSDASHNHLPERLDTSGGQSDWLLKTFPKICPLMQFKLEVLAPSKYNAAPFEDILNIPLSVRAKDKIIKDYKTLEEADRYGEIQRTTASLFPVDSRSEDIKNKIKTENVALFREDGTCIRPHLNDKFDRTLLLLNQQDMRDFNFPLPVPGCRSFNDPEFKLTHEKYAEVKASSPMFAVDCEMCLTCKCQLELTSISVVNEKMELEYHTLVKPVNKIINYLTMYSGITKNMLENVTTRLEDVQRDLRELLPPDAILVGHSLDSDLRALKLMHPYVIDSSLVYNLTHVRKKRSSLKHLTKMFLGKNIQNSHDGHNPTEDAGASLELILLKLENDINFGDVIQGGKIPWAQGKVGIQEEQAEDYKKDTEALVYTAQKYVRNLFQYAETLSMAVLASPSCLEKYSDMMSFIGKKVTHFEVLPGNKHLSVRTAQVSINKDFTYVHLKMDTKLDQCQAPESRQHRLKKLDKQLHRIYEGAAPKALILFVFSGSSLDVPADQRSNGLVMLSIKGQPFKA